MHSLVSFKSFPLAPFKDHQLARTGQENVLAYAEFYLQVFHDLNLQIHWDMCVLGTATFRAG